MTDLERLEEILMFNYEILEICKMHADEDLLPSIANRTAGIEKNTRVLLKRLLTENRVGFTCDIDNKSFAYDGR